jgi:hypothetical protein
MRGGMGLHRLGVGRLHPVAAGHLHRAEDDLQQVQRAGGLEAVGMGRNPAHRVEADRAAGMLAWWCRGNRSRAGRSRSPRQRPHRPVPPPARGCAGPVMPVRRPPPRAHFPGQIALARCWNTVRFPARPRPDRAPPPCRPRCGHPRAPVDHEGLAFGIAHEQALFRPLGLVHQQGRIGPTSPDTQVDLPRLQQAVDQRQDQQARRCPA